MSFSTPFEIYAQHNQYYDVMDDWSVGLKMGSNHYSGDLSSNYLSFPSVNVDARDGTTIGVFISKRINNAFSAIVDGEIANLHDIGNIYYNDKFNAKIIQFNLTIDADLFYVFFSASSRIKILPYMGAGITFYHASAYNRLNNKLVRDTSYNPSIGISSLNDHKKIAFNIPMGLKITQKIGHYLEVGVDFRINNTMTDEIDATVGGDNSSIYNNILPLNNLPQNSWYDAWGYLGVSSSYKIPTSTKSYIKNARYF